MAKGGARALTLAAGSTEDPIRAVSGDQLTLVSAAATVLGTGATASLQGTAPKIALPIVGNIVDDFAALATVTGPGKVYLDRSSGQVLTAGAENITDYLLSAFITSTSASITSIAPSNAKQTLALGGLGNTVVTSACETLDFVASASAEVTGPVATLSLGDCDAIGLT